MSPGHVDDRYVDEELQALSGSKSTLKELTLEAASSQHLLLKHSTKGGQSLEDLRGSVV